MKGSNLVDLTENQKASKKVARKVLSSAATTELTKESNLAAMMVPLIVTAEKLLEINAARLLLSIDQNIITCEHNSTITHWTVRRQP